MLITKWMYKTSGIKPLFEEVPSKELTFKVVNALVPQLKKIQKDLLKSEIIEDTKNYISDSLLEIIDNFEFILYLDNNEDEWDDFDFEGDWVSLFDGYMLDLYDLCDMKPLDKNNDVRKLIWIG